MTAMNPTAKRPPRTQDELRKAADHVNYEIATLVYAGEKLAARPAGSDGDIALESFLLHFRNLRAFLCPTKQRLGDDDVIASDFLNERKGRDLGDWTFLQEHKGKLDKMLAHITYARAVYIYEPPKPMGLWRNARANAHRTGILFFNASYECTNLVQRFRVDAKQRS